ncbi:hypothetical protein [Sulfitobacter litoralis]|uniref:hypothetical protein n=1 Tax=Sulfitobacter litoralis TaxID=335975 RepID=UPI002B272C17|nr:hypothetical protein [Sulfitobacter litoralis]
MTTKIDDFLPYLNDEDRANHLKAIGSIGDAFAYRTSIKVDPQRISNLPAVREHVLSGGAIALDIEAAISSLKNEPSISNALIAAEVEEAEIGKIQSDTATMSRADRLTYARERGLDRPRADVADSMSLNSHLAILQGLGPQQRIAYARRHGIS